MKNPDLNSLELLQEMYDDSYFPNHLVDKIRSLLHDIANTVIEEKIDNLDVLYRLSHQATEKVNELQEEFEEAGSEIETVARDSIGVSFKNLTDALGFDADMEELISPRDW